MKFDVSIRRDKLIDLIIPLEMAKSNSRIDHDYEDDLLLTKLYGAIAAVESYTERIYQPRKVTVRLSEFKDKIKMPVGPIATEGLTVSYYDVLGEKWVIPSANYQLFSYQNGHNQCLVLGNYEVPELQSENEFPVEIKSTIGELEVPDDVVSAILLLFSESETYRENRPQSVTNSAAINLLRPYRRY